MVPTNQRPRVGLHPVSDDAPLMTNFSDMRLPLVRTAVAPDGSDVRVLLGLAFYVMLSGSASNNEVLIGFVFAADIFLLLTAFATVIGALLGHYLLHKTQGWAPVLLGIAGASMIYVALSDLIPGLHKRAELGATLQQLIMISLGIFTVGGVGRLVGH